MLLAALARDRVTRAGLAVASPVFAHRLMTQAVAEVLQGPEPAGTARALAGSVREFLRLQLGPAGLASAGQGWPGRVLDVARLAELTGPGCAPRDWWTAPSSPAWRPVFPRHVNG